MGRGGSTIGKSLPSGHMTFAGLAKATGIPVDTLRRWHKNGELRDAGQVDYGKLKVWVFDLDSIVSARRLRDSKSRRTSSANTDS